jgi:hypothetical protein
MEKAICVMESLGIQWCFVHKQQSFKVLLGGNDPKHAPETEVLL